MKEWTQPFIFNCLGSDGVETIGIFKEFNENFYLKCDAHLEKLAIIT